MGSDGAQPGAEGKAAAEQQPPAPPAPPAPSISLSQIVPLIVSMAMSKYNLQEMGYTRHVEIGYIVIQVVCLSLLGFIYAKIAAMAEDGEKLTIPEVKQFGQVVTPATEQTPKEYDSTKLLAQAKQIGMGAVILGGVYYKWQYLFPLVLQMLTTPLQLVESPLFRIHVLGRDVERPFPEPNPLGLPMPPEPAPQDDAANKIGDESSEAAAAKKDDAAKKDE